MSTTAGRFYGQCFRKAFQGKIALAELVTAILLLVAVPLGLLGATGWAPAILFGSLFFLLFLVGLVSAPYRIFRELEDESEALSARLFNRQLRQQAMSQLWGFRAEGVGLRNQHVVAGEYGEWNRRYHLWLELVYAEARLISLNLEAWLRTLDRVRPPPLLSDTPANEEHARDRQNMSEVLLRLQEFLQAEMLSKDIEQSGD
jgi:hypothetical protein